MLLKITQLRKATRGFVERVHCAWIPASNKHVLAILQRDILPAHL
jgi:hypothetical protein